MKKILLFLSIFLVLTGCSSKKEQSTPLFFEVSKEGYTDKIYLLGSIHVADETVYPLPKTITNSYKESDYLAVEFDMIKYMDNIGSQMSLMQKFIYDDGTSIKDYVSEEKYNKMKQILEEVNLYSSLYDTYKPIMWETLIENASASKSGLEDEYGIDMHFLNMAKEDNKNILELESAELQYNVLLGFSDELTLKLLDDSINNYDESIEGLKELYQAYKKGNKEEIEALLFTDEETDELLDEYNDALITKRNIGMYKGLDKQFKKGNTIFCTVGLAHIIGEDGLVNIFKQNGYTVVQK